MQVRVPRIGCGHPRIRPVRVIADKAYSSRAIRAYLRRRGIVTTIPEPADQTEHRRRRGSRGGHPPAFDSAAYRQRNVVERSINRIKQWRGIATRFHKKARYFHASLTLASVLIRLRTGPSTSHALTLHVRLRNRIRGLLTQIHPTLERALGRRRYWDKTGGWRHASRADLTALLTSVPAGPTVPP